MQCLSKIFPAQISCMYIFSSFKFLDETVPFYQYLILQVVPFTPSAGILEWVDRTIPLGEYLLGRFESCSCCFDVKCFIMLLQEIVFPCSARNGGAHGRYGVGDWTFLQCREYMMNVS